MMWRSPLASPAAWFAVALATVSNSAHAACPIELATYRDRDQVASLEFRPREPAAATTNAFRMILPKDVVLDGLVLWTEGVSRPVGMLSHKCPEGDVTGEELEACAAWQGVIYAMDANGAIDLLPEQGKAAPQALILSDLGYQMRNAPFWEGAGLEREPWDVFSLSGCQE